MAHLKLAFRTLVKTPFITAVAVISLALGIGANTAIFSLFDQMLLSPLPAAEPERLVNLSAPGPKPGSQSCTSAGDCDVVFSYPMFRDLEVAETGFSGVAAHRTFSVNLALEGKTVNGEGMMVSGSYFPVLGLRPALGRLLDPGDDERIGEHFVAVLSHAYWTNQLGADADVLNRSIIVNGIAMTVVGVGPRGFDGTTMGSRADVFVPISMRGVMNAGWDRFDDRRNYWVYLFARLAPGVTMEQARTSAQARYQAIINDVEAPLQGGMSAPTLERFRAKEILVEEGHRGQSRLHREVRMPLILLFAITGVVLLIACSNIANLLLARGARRSQEMAIRGSLGASRAQLMKQVLTESLILAVLGGAASLLVAEWTLGFIGSILPAQAASAITLELRPGALLFVAPLVLGTGVLFGVYPALHSTRPDLITLIKADAGQPSGARSAARFRNGLVTAQVALSMTLLVLAGLFVRSLMNVSRVDLGITTENLITFTVAPELNGYEPERSGILFQEIEEQLAAIPGVTGVTGSLVPILSGDSWGTDVHVEGFQSGPDIDSNSRLNEIGADYFRTLGIPLLAGREFTPGDARGAPRVAIVNEAFTRKFGLDGRNGVGKWMSTGRDDDLGIQIVGVVQDAKYNEVKDQVPPLFFTPYRQDETLGWMTFYLRTAVDPGPVLRAVPDVVKGLDGNLPVVDLKTMEQQVEENIVMDRLISTLSAAFAVLATLLASVGLYGVLAYSVAQRTREIGVRMALGADPGRVKGMILGQVGRMVIVGCVTGILAALGLGRAARSLLFGLEGHDPVVVSTAAVLLAVIALVAGYLPAARASRIHPMEALRDG